MKAMVYEKYGPPNVLKLKEIDKPIPKDNEVLIKVSAASLNAFDWHVMRANPFFVRLMGFGLLKPKMNILGADVSGCVESVGKNVKQFIPGDKVFGCGRGSFAEYTCISADKIAPKPINSTFNEAAAYPMAALTALQGLRDIGKIQKGQKVLIDGASGGVGTFAIQLAKSFETEVTAVCSTKKIDIAYSLGADNVIDYTKEKLLKNCEKYDLIFVANGNRSIFEYKNALNPNGICVMAGGDSRIFQILKDMLLGLWISKTTSVKMESFIANINQRDLLYIKELSENHKIESVIDRIYSLEETIDAIRYLEEGHAKGKIVLSAENIGRS